MTEQEKIDYLVQKGHTPLDGWSVAMWHVGDPDWEQAREAAQKMVLEHNVKLLTRSQ